MNTVYEVGYRAPGADEYIAALCMQHPALLLIDTRLNPASWLPSWRKSALQEAYGSRYHWAGRFLGNVNYKNGGPIVLADPETGLRGLCQYLSEGFDLILLCGCVDFERCHRKVILQLLLDQMPDVQIVRQRVM